MRQPCGPVARPNARVLPAILRQDYDAFSADIGEKFDIWADVRKVLRDLPDRAEAEAREHEIDRNLQTAGHNDMDARRVDMDRDGVAADVIYHSSQNGQPIPFIEGGSLFFNPTGSDLEKRRPGSTSTTIGWQMPARRRRSAIPASSISRHGTSMHASGKWNGRAGSASER